MCRWMLDSTASALNGSPSWKVTPSRRFSRYSTPASEHSHETASPGSDSSASLKVRSRSYMYEIPCQVAQVDLVRSQLAGLAVVTMRAMPPRLPSPPPSEESGEPLGDGVVALACPPSPPAGLVGSSEPPPQA